MSPGPAVGDLASRLAASVGDAVYEDTTGLAHPPTPRMSWIDLQHEVGLVTLAQADDIAANFLYQDMRVGTVARWADEDWPARLDALASLPAGPRPSILTVLFMVDAPAAAGPALVRLVMAHGHDEKDVLVRCAATNLRRFRSADAGDDVDLVDWDARHRQPELFRWFLELMGEPGTRTPLVAAAERAGRLPEADAAWLAASDLSRPAWIDGEVPWEVDEVVHAGDVRLPDGSLTGGDPWWTGGAEGLPWIVPLEPGTYPVRVATAVHPLAGRECAALHLVLDESAVQRWVHVPGQVVEEGYTVQVGIAGFGAVAVYDQGVIHDSDHADLPGASPPFWRTLDAGATGSLVFCSVGPQHQTCRTWVGTAADGRPAAVVTDLGLLDLDLAAYPSLPWE